MLFIIVPVSVGIVSCIYIKKSRNTRLCSGMTAFLIGFGVGTLLLGLLVRPIVSKVSITTTVDSPVATVSEVDNKLLIELSDGTEYMLPKKSVTVVKTVSANGEKVKSTLVGRFSRLANPDLMHKLFLVDKDFISSKGLVLTLPDTGNIIKVKE